MRPLPFAQIFLLSESSGHVNGFHPAMRSINKDADGEDKGLYGGLRFQMEKR
jgi:hypothetical protein